MRWLKQSASVDVPIGPFLDSIDGVTAETALTITQPDVRLKKNGGNWAQKAAAQTLSHEENGNYEVTLDATDTDTLGLLRLHVAESGALPVWEDFMVVPANVWDSLFGASTLLVTPANASITAAKFAANAIDAGALAADAVTEIQSGLATAASISALNNLSAAQVNAEVDTALADYGAAQPGDIPTANANADALLDRASAVDTYTVRQILRVLAAALGGEITFSGNTASVGAIDGSKNRITSETDAQEQRTNITIDAT
jgi:hypothetical protein